MAYADNIKQGEYDLATDDELKNVLITLDGLGQKIKSEVLEEIISRYVLEAREKGYEDGQNNILENNS